MTINYIISEYIETQLFKGAYLTKFDKHSWFVYGDCVIMYKPDDNILNIKESVFRELSDMFSLTTKETRIYFKNWAVRKLKLPDNLKMLN